MSKYKILFADLDGTLIDTISGNTFPKGIWDMYLKFIVLNKIKELAPEYIFIVSNQGGIEKGFVNQDEFESKLSYICNSIKSYCGIINIDATYCIHNDKDNNYRKPNTGMLRGLIEMHGVLAFSNLSEMLMIGDASGKPGQFSDSDKKTAENFGIDYLDVEDFYKTNFND